MRIFTPYLTLLAALMLCGGTMVAQHTTENKADKQQNGEVDKRHNPKKATLLALIPGAGQIYNKKYWKLPIVYAGFGVTGYYAVANGAEYKKYKDAYNCSVTLQDECTNPLAEKYSADDLKTIRDYYRRNMELSYIIMGAWYGLQILDATVDAHLYYWEVDDNLSVRVDPAVTPIPGAEELPFMPSAGGLKITVRF